MINIAIDGPSAAGKSTIAKRLASTLSYVHLDTGAMYRAIAYVTLKNGVDTQNETALSAFLSDIQIEFHSNRLFVNGDDVSDAIRSNEMSMRASEVAKIQQVRKKLVEIQRALAKNKGYILDGRDIGSVVLPDAEVKIYLVADVDARAKRRYDEYIQKGIDVEYNAIYEDIKARDLQDTTRLVSPLTKAKDAIEIDTSNLSIDEVCEAIYKIVRKEMK